jgi:hypothetical protein
MREILQKQNTASKHQVCHAPFPRRLVIEFSNRICRLVVVEDATTPRQ